MVCCGQNPSQELGSHSVSLDSVPSIGEAVSSLDSNIMNIYQAKNNDFWFGGKALFKYDGEILIKYTTADGLAAPRIRGIKEDQEGNMYFDTGAGINKFDGEKFETLKLAETQFPNDVWKLYPDDLWFEGNWNKNGIYRYDSEHLYHLTFPKHELEDIYYTNHPNNTFSPYEVYKTFKDSNGHVWFGGAVFGACRFDGKSLQWISEEPLLEIDYGPAPGVRSIVEDADGHYWFSNDLQHRYRVKNENEHIHEGDSWYEILPGIDISEQKGMRPYCMSMVEDKDRNMWIVTYVDGVYKYDGKSIIHYPMKIGDRQIQLFSAYKDLNGALWLGSHNGGAFRFNGTQFEQFMFNH